MGNVSIKEITYGKWGNCIEVSNGIVDLVATIDFGPRIIRFGFCGKENEFFEDIEDQLSNDSEKMKVFEGGAWHIYGGHRLWLSPEVEPRSYYPDNTPVEWHEVQNGISLKPQVQIWNQVQLELEVTMDPDSTRVKVLHKVTNTGAWESEYAPWALTVMAPGGKEIIPQPQRDTGFLGNRVLALWPYSKMNDSRVYWGDKFISLQQDTTATTAFKFGISNDDGWAAYFNHDNMFVKYYNHILDGNYPDFGVSFETYTNKSMLEIESLGQLKKTKPGECIEHIEEWQLFKDVKAPSNDEEEIENLVKTRIN